MSYILAIDQGTTATKSVIVDKNGAIVGLASIPYAQHYPSPGFVEHSGDEIKASLKKSVEQALGKAEISPHKIISIGITNQRETIGLFDKNNHADLPFIVWQCRRSQEICERLSKKNMGPRLHQLTGLHIDPYFSATKLLWIFENYPGLLAKAANGELLAGTIDSYVAHWLSGNTSHVTDISNASRTMLMDIEKGSWSDECLDIFSIPKNCLPRICKNIDSFGTTKNLDFLPDGIPINAMAGDQQAALFGHGCFEEGSAKATFGTGCFILLNIGEKLSYSKHGLLTSVAYHIGEKKIYCLEGSAFIAGAAVQFLIDAFGLIDRPEDIEALALSVSDNGGVIFVPALCGLGAPHWRASARGSLLGLSRGTTKAHIARATLEGIALQNSDILEAMAEDARTLKLLKVDGGASANNLLMQIQADLLGIPCWRSPSAHKTALGIAFMSGLAAGVFSDFESIKKLDQGGLQFLPSRDRTWADSALTSFREALKHA